MEVRGHVCEVGEEEVMDMWILSPVRVGDVIVYCYDLISGGLRDQGRAN